MENKTILIFEYQGKEMLRIPDADFLPACHDTVDIDSYPLSNSKNSEDTWGYLWTVTGRLFMFGCVTVEIIPKSV